MLELGDHVWYWNHRISTDQNIPRAQWFPGANPADPNDYLGHGKEIYHYVVHADEIARGRPHMRNYEGTYGWLNNNPGNIKRSTVGTDFGQYRGKVCWNNFLVFPTWSAGYDAIGKLLRSNIYVNLSILDAFKKYAPESEGNNPVAYANAVANALGLSVSTRIGDLDDVQMLTVQDKIQEIEGIRPGDSLAWDSDEIPWEIAELLPSRDYKARRPTTGVQAGEPFTVEVTAPVAVPGYTRGHGGPNEGGHAGSNWYIRYGMDLGGTAGTAVYAAFSGHVTKYQPHVPSTDSGRVYGAQIFMRSQNNKMGGFYTHLTDIRDGLQQGSTVEVGDYLGRIHQFGGIPPHLHLALVEIIGGAPNGTYQGVDLYRFFLSLQTDHPDLFIPVQFWQDGRPPEPVYRMARDGVLFVGDQQFAGVESQFAPQQVATLALETLRCKETDDVGSDEPIITFNDEEVWRAANVDAGDSRDISYRRSFANFVRLKLFDEELGVNDEIGSTVVEARDAGTGLRTAHMSNGTANYVIEYRVE